jgi:uncharacterized protein YqeY
MFRRRRFGDLIDRQLRVFSEDHGDRLAAIRTAHAAYRDAGREESAAKEDAEAEVYATYLPAQLDDAALRGIVEATVARLGASGPRDAGPVIREVLAETAGQADGGRVAALVRDVLAAS